MQYLEIVTGLLQNVVRAGIKRWQEREIVSGPMLYVNVSDASDMVVVWGSRLKICDYMSWQLGQEKARAGLMQNCSKGCVNTIRQEK